MKDLFEYYENLPVNVQNLINEHQESKQSYKDAERLKTSLKAIGYSCDYGLDGVPFGLHKIEPMKEIIENNKLIAEFMGYKTYPFRNYTMFIFDENNHRTTIDTHYHTSWDWLIPVVEKIENYNEFTNVLFALQGCAIDVNIKNGFHFSIDCSTKIEAVYRACVEFIKWYNLNK